jgi:hypothetical protein
MSTATVSEAANKWLATGERGISSEVIFSRLTGVYIADAVWGAMTPSDPSDLRRCLLLLEAVPEFKTQFHKMSGVSRAWASAVDHWDELAGLLESEVPDWRDKNHRGRAPKTYERMKEIGL